MRQTIGNTAVCKSQDDILKLIWQDIERVGRLSAKFKLTTYLGHLYSCRFKGEIHFYAQDKDGFPVEKIPTVIARGTPFYSTLLTNNLFSPKAWESSKHLRPDTYIGHWPPNNHVGLFGFGLRAGKADRISWPKIARIDRPDVEHSILVDEMLQFWYGNIDIRYNENIGYGLEARKSIPTGTYIGEYTGELVPYDESVPDEETEYQFGISIGKPRDVYEHQAKCWVDATRKGSIFRFAAHSCDPNATVIEQWQGAYNRKLLIRTDREIAPGEAITLSYGEEWFRGEQRCRCGSSQCQNPPQSGEHGFVDFTVGTNTEYDDGNIDTEESMDDSW